LFVGNPWKKGVHAQQWKTYTEADGLASNTVNAVFQSHDGVMWFGTDNGVSRFDGTWRAYTTADGLASNAVNAVFQTQDGAIWFGTSGGATRLDGTRWRSFTRADGLADNTVNTVFQAQDGAIWFGTNGGATRFDGTNWKTLTKTDGLADNAVFAIFQAQDQAIWFGTGDGVSRFDGTNWKSYTKADGLAHSVVSSVFQDQDGAIWFGTGRASKSETLGFAAGGGGVSRYDGATWKTFARADGLVGNIVHAVLQSRDGAMWFGTAGDFLTGGGGVSRYDGKNWKTFVKADGLGESLVTSAFQDRDGTIWFGTTGGVSRYDGTWRTFTKTDGLADNSVWSVFQDRDGAMWFGTGNLVTGGGGVNRYDGKTWQTYTRANTGGGLADNTVLSVFQSRDGAMWFGIVGGVSRYDGKTWQTYTTADGLAGSVVVSIFQSQDGAMWFGVGDLLGGGGVSRFDGKTWQKFTRASTGGGLDQSVVFSVFQSRDGAMWFGMGDLLGGGGVSRYDGKTWQRFTRASTGGGLVDNAVTSIFQSRDGAIWFGTGNLRLVIDLSGIRAELLGGGVSRYDGKTWQRFTRANTASGLAENVVFSISQDREGAMWFGTAGGGVSRFDGAWRRYTTSDGLSDSFVWSVFQDRDGGIWFGTNDGVSHFRRPTNPLTQTVILRSPPSTLGSSRFFFECRGYEIGYDGVPPLSYVLTRDTDQPEERDWSPFAFVSGFELTERELTNGKWTFHVRARDRYGNIDATPATSAFTVDLTPPTVAISSPRSGDAVSGNVPLSGVAFDPSAVPDLERFTLEYGQGMRVGEVKRWTRIGQPQSTPIESGVLGTWNTEGLPDGSYVLRISASDRLDHTSEHTITVTLVSALSQLEKESGGHVLSVRGTVDLMVPPNGLDRDQEVQVVFKPEKDLPPSPPGIKPTGIVFEIGPSALSFNPKKRSTLTLGYQPSDIAKLSESDLAIFTLSGATWTRLGGTVDAAAHKVSVAVNAPGVYALFEAPSVGGAAGVSDVACQPRIISPAGGVYPPTTDISFRLDTRASVDVRIYSVSGNLIRTVVQGQSLNEGLNTVRWDGRDSDGRVVTSGIYIVVIQADGKAANKTVAVLNK